MSEGTKRGACPGGPARDAGSEPVRTGEAGKSPLLREVRSLAVRLAVFAAVLWVLLTQVYLVTQASGSEMFPAVKDGDLVLGSRLEKTMPRMMSWYMSAREGCGWAACWPGAGTS